MYRLVRHICRGIRVLRVKGVNIRVFPTIYKKYKEDDTISFFKFVSLLSEKRVKYIKYIIT